MKLNKLILGLILFILTLFSVSALVPYTGIPQLPYIMFGHVEWNDQMLSGARMQITNVNTGYTKLFVTNGDGYWQEEGGNWNTVSPSRPPVQYGDVIKVKVLDGCGVGDVCEKQFIAYSEGYGDYAMIDFSITGNLVCPQITCPSYSCPSCHCGGGSCTTNVDCSEIKCKELFPCTQTQCQEQQLCPIEKICDTCPLEKVCETCVKNECDNQSDNVKGVLAAILSFLIGGGAIYISLGTSNKVKVVKKDGKDYVHHQHPTISGYHSPDTVHKTNAHAKGELVPKYVKVDGVWTYQKQ